jgi:hypothetical protein
MHIDQWKVKYEWDESIMSLLFREMDEDSFSYTFVRYYNPLNPPSGLEVNTDTMKNVTLDSLQELYKLRDRVTAWHEHQWRLRVITTLEQRLRDLTDIEKGLVWLL